MREPKNKRDNRESYSPRQEDPRHNSREALRKKKYHKGTDVSKSSLNRGSDYLQQIMISDYDNE